MRWIVLDTTVLLSWFTADGAGRSLRREYEAGVLGIVVPPSLTTDFIGALAADRERSTEALVQAAAEVDRLAFEVRRPAVEDTVRWIARGLSPQDAPYAALASHLELPLMTANDDVLRRAATVARPLVDS